VEPDILMAMGRHALEASLRAIPAIYRNCSVVPATAPLQVNAAVLAEAMELVEFAYYQYQSGPAAAAFLNA